MSDMTHRSEIRGTETDTTAVAERFGGIDTPAAIMGMFAALGVLMFLGSLIAAGAGGLEYQLNAIDVEGNFQEMAIAGAALAIAVIFVSFLAGGWAAARMARYDGGLNGLATAVWLLLLVAIFAALGAWVGQEYNAFQQAGLPDWFSQFRNDEVTAGAIISGVVAIVAMFAGGYLGGLMGESYHRRADSALADGRRT